MDKFMMGFFVTLIVVAVLCLIAVIARQVWISKSINGNIVSGSDNHVMNTAKYSGKYSTCNNIGEADEEY